MYLPCAVRQCVSGVTARPMTMKARTSNAAQQHLLGPSRVAIIARASSGGEEEEETYGNTLGIPSMSSFWELMSQLQSWCFET